MPAIDWSRVGAWTGGAVHSLALSPRFTADEIALAATHAGLFHSSDGGRTWQRAGNMGYVPARCVAFDPSGTAFATTQAGALIVSRDGGAQWQTLDAWGFGPINALAFATDEDGNTHLFAATDEGIFRSPDGGSTWQSANFGLLDPEILCLACAPDFAASEVVWAGGANGGLYRSRNGGRAWREAGHGLPDAAIQCLAFTSAGLLAGTEAGVFRLADGDAWLPAGLEALEVNCIVAFGEALLAGTTRGIFRAGADRQWHPTGLSEPVLALACAANGVALCGTAHNGIWRSDDGGRTWQRADAGLAAHTPPLAARMGNGALLLADALGGAAYSEDGATWRPILMSDPLVCVAASPTAHQPAFVAATERQIFAWDAASCALLPLPTQPSLEEDDAITALALADDGTCLTGTRAGRCKIRIGERDWHDMALPGTGIVAGLHFTRSANLFAVRIASKTKEDAPFSAEVWRATALAQPDPDETVWRMVMGLDGLRAPLASLAAGDNRAVLAAQNVIAQAYIFEGQPVEVRRISVEPGIAFTGIASYGEDILLASNRGILYVNSATGAHWPIGRALVDVPVVALFVERDGLWAVTLGGEVWRYPVR
ncbi:MAG: WD40/YVTN/BNR-like repeat-containing protein [Candidatus Brachytrichaceae bacterium NZ_4S206]|jgi:photosystem II stability/assembly factor-like uncharacterized protein